MFEAQVTDHIFAIEDLRPIKKIKSWNCKDQHSLEKLCNYPVVIFKILAAFPLFCSSQKSLEMP